MYLLVAEDGIKRMFSLSELKLMKLGSRIIRINKINDDPGDFTAFNSPEHKVWLCNDIHIIGQWLREDKYDTNKMIPIF